MLWKTANNEALRTQIKRNKNPRQQQSLGYAELALGSLIDNVADANCRKNFEEIWCNATV